MCCSRVFRKLNIKRKNIIFYSLVVIYAFVIIERGNIFVQTVNAKLTDYSQFVVQAKDFKPVAVVRKVPLHGTTQALDITTISTVNTQDLRFVIESGTFLIGKYAKQNETEPRSTSIRNPTKEFVTEKTKYTYHGQDLMALPTYSFDPDFKNPCWKDTVNESGIHCLPYFFIIGAKKCGTTHLWSTIFSHPDVVGPGFKEAQWFARRRFRSGQGDIKYYVQMFDRAARKITNLKSFTSEHLYPRITGDASPSNLHLNSHWRYLPGNEKNDEPKYVILDYIKHILPMAKIIIVFRDPIERLYSDYYHEFGRLRYFTSTSPGHFHKLVVLGLQLYKQCFQHRTVRSCVYDERIYMEVKIHIQLGLYHVYWRDLTRIFPRDQILLLHNNELREGSRTTTKVYDFLKLRKTYKLRKRQRNNTRRTVDASNGDMLNETRILLEEFYKPHNEHMYRLTRDKTFLYDKH